MYKHDLLEGGDPKYEHVLYCALLIKTYGSMPYFDHLTKMSSVVKVAYKTIKD